MQIKRILVSASFRIVIFYVLLYMVIAFGFLWLMFSVLGAEIENSVKVEIEREYKQLTLNLPTDTTDELEQRLQNSIRTADVEKAIYILQDQDGGVILSNYPYPANLKLGWFHLAEVLEQDLPEIDQRQDKKSLLYILDFITKNPHDKGYVGLVSSMNGNTLLVGRTLDRIDETKKIFLRIALIVLPLSIFLAILGGLLLSRMVMRRIDIINTQCRIIRRQGDLSLRIQNEKPSDEYGLLISNINAMLDNIDKAVKNVQEVSDDVAHDLRTPLTRLKYGLESGLVDTKANSKTLRRVIDAGLQETNELLETFSAILRITQINTGLKKSNFQVFDLAALARHVAEAYEPIADENEHVINVNCNPENCDIFADKDMVAQMISNLIENALQHGGPSLQILIQVTCSPNGTALSVQDNGCGIPTTEMKNIFKKFYRLDKSRTTNGNGLGLSMVKAIADLHDAVTQISDCAPGSKFIITFPVQSS